MSPEVIYIAGPIADRDFQEAMDTFDAAVEVIRHAKPTAIVINPFDFTRALVMGTVVETITRAEWLQFDPAVRAERIVVWCSRLPHDARALAYNKDFAALLREATGIAFLPNWFNSEGATLEGALAASRRLDRYYISDEQLHEFNEPPTAIECWRRHFLLINRKAAQRAKIFDTTPPAPPTPPESVLAEADRLVSTDRQASYGHPLDNFTDIATLWNAYLTNARWATGTNELTAEDVALLMDLLKVAREQRTAKRDNRVDGPGYWKCLDLIITERAARRGTNT